MRHVPAATMFLYQSTWLPYVSATKKYHLAGAATRMFHQAEWTKRQLRHAAHQVIDAGFIPVADAVGNGKVPPNSLTFIGLPNCIQSRYSVQPMYNQDRK